VGKADTAHTQLVESADQVDVGAKRLDPLHREEKPDPAVGSCSLDLGAIAADGEPWIMRYFLVEERELVDRDPKRKLRQVAVVEEDRGAHEPDPAVVELLPELASENADPLVLVDALLVEVEKQVEMEIDDAVVDASHPSVEPLERRCHNGVIIANVSTRWVACGG
jgi:hypothetical protein